MNENDVIITDDDDADSDEDDYETLGFSESLLPENILSPRGDLPRYRQAATCNLSCDPEQDSNLLSTRMCQGELPLPEQQRFPFTSFPACRSTPYCYRASLPVHSALRISASSLSKSQLPTADKS